MQVHLVDGTYELFRHFFAMPSHRDADGREVAAVRGVIASILGMSVDDVIARSTWNAAKAIRQDRLGHLSVGAPADVAVLRVENGHFGFVDSFGARMNGDARFVCELTVRDGKVVYDLNGMFDRVSSSPKKSASM